MVRFVFPSPCTKYQETVSNHERFFPYLCEFIAEMKYYSLKKQNGYIVSVTVFNLKNVLLLIIML